MPIKAVILFAALMLIVISGCATQNPPVQIDKERQVKVEKALKELKDKDANVRDSAVWTLGSLGAKEYAKDIAELLKDEDADVRRIAVSALSELGAKGYAKDIAELLKDEDVQVTAVSVLGLLGAKEYTKDIAELLKDVDGNTYLRGDVIWALGKLGAKEYADEIGRLMNDTSECGVWDEAKKDWRQTTVSAEAERVLKEWDVDIEKLKEGR